MKLTCGRNKDNKEIIEVLFMSTISEILTRSTAQRKAKCPVSDDRALTMTFPIERRRDLHIKGGTENDTLKMYWDPVLEIMIICTPEKYEELTREPENARAGA